MEKIVYATGTSGTIGRHIHGLVTPLNLRLDFLDNFEFSDLVMSRNLLIHFAGIVGYRSSEKNENHSRKINIESTTVLAKKALEAGIGKFVFVSTAHVYKSSNSPLSETSVISPINEYAEQKFEAEEELRDIFKFAEEKLCIVRVFGVLDWDMKPDTLGGAIKSLVHSNFSERINFGLDIRDFLTPQRIARTILAISRLPDLYGVVNLCSGREVSVKQAVAIMLKKSNLLFKDSFVNMNCSDTPVIVGNNSKLLTYFPDFKMDWSPSNYKIENEN